MGTEPKVREDNACSKFRFLGVIFGPDQLPLHPRLTSHASNPTPLHLGGAEYRVYYASRDVHNRSSIAYFDFDVESMEVTNIGQEPVFSLGENETFFSHGATPGALFEMVGQMWLSFMGWKIPGQGQHWRGEIGLLRLNQEKTEATLYPEEPILGRGASDPVSLSYPGIIRLDAGGFVMIYGSTVTWNAGNDEMLHVLKAASSLNGFDWQPVGSVHPFTIGSAQAFSGPNLVSTGAGLYDVYFSYRGAPPSKYKIGRSRFDSNDFSWRRLPDPVLVGLDPNTIGLEMQEYPALFRHEGRTFMLFNGDGYGRTGVGLAVAD